MADDLHSIETLFPGYVIPQEVEPKKIRSDDSDCPRCGRCNRKLKDPESMSRGMGKVCYKKHQDYTEKFCVNIFDEGRGKKCANKRLKK